MAATTAAATILETAMDGLSLLAGASGIQISTNLVDISFLSAGEACQPVIFATFAARSKAHSQTARN
jgi:hypothetical protein